MRSGGCPNGPGDLSAAERDYLARGREYRRSRIRRRRMLFSATAGILVLALVLALVLGSLYVLQRRTTEQRDATARSRALAGLSTGMATQDPMTSIMLALAADRTSPTEEAGDALLRHYA